jgi:hypothetical protein
MPARGLSPEDVPVLDEARFMESLPEESRTVTTALAGRW